MTLHSGRRSEVPFWGAHEKERGRFQLALNIVSCHWIHCKVLIRDTGAEGLMLSGRAALYS